MEKGPRDKNAVALTKRSEQKKETKDTYLIMKEDRQPRSRNRGGFTERKTVSVSSRKSPTKTDKLKVHVEKNIKGKEKEKRCQSLDKATQTILHQELNGNTTECSIQSIESKNMGNSTTEDQPLAEKIKLILESPQQKSSKEQMNKTLEDKSLIDDPETNPLNPVQLQSSDEVIDDVARTVSNIFERVDRSMEDVIEKKDPKDENSTNNKDGIHSLRKELKKSKRTTPHFLDTLYNVNYTEDSTPGSTIRVRNTKSSRLRRRQTLHNLAT